MELKVIRSTCLVILLLISLITQTESKKILCLLGVGTETALKWNEVLINELAAKGHDLTVVTPSIWDLESETNIDFIYLENTQQFLRQRYENNNNSHNALDQSNWKFIVNWYDQHMARCRGNLESSGLSEVLKLALQRKRVFDLLIYDVTYGPNCLLHIAYLFGATPIVGITSSTLTADILNINQHSGLNAALDPYVLSDFGKNMNYWKRLYNTALFGFDYAYRQWVVRPVIEGLWSNNVKNNNVPKSLDELMPRFKVILANHHPALHTLTALAGNIIAVPGLHIQNKKSIKPSPDLLEFIEISLTDLILIDLDLNQLGESNVLAIIKVIRKFPKYNFIWNTGESKKLLKNKPNNVFIANNLNNLEVMELVKANSEIKIVLTVPEILRIQECLYQGIPMITVALSPEQRYLAKRIEEQGFGLNLELSNLVNLAGSFEEILTNKNFLKKAQQLQVTLRNPQNPPLDTAVWWVEHLLQYPQANDYLISTNKNEVGFFARNSFDIVFLFEIIILICIINMILVCKQTIENFKQISKTKRKREEKKEKQVNRMKKEKKVKKHKA
ncbi:UDP-glycosyltransferase UGT4 [Lucilia sericata]|uniref:UDP-glycosyltransferase UGT4 n=1 Tax=Lucilia sericata TaxID=13632 RepID=UPI0018A82B5E|nr:UDP-glycosyltransferase UGT4 [Lucilia sericata]